MWVRIDDGFATHPKVVVAGPLPALIQIRAICYASQHKTDGMIPDGVVHLFLEGFKALGFSADPVEWGNVMVVSGLWEREDNKCYRIHDYLDWNVSKDEYNTMRKQKSLAGQKGMKSRWGKRSQRITPVISPVITPVITDAYHHTSTSTDTSSLNSLPPIRNLQSNGHSQDFDQFWAAYPKKVGKLAALKAWTKAKHLPMVEKILETLTMQKLSEQWTRDNGQYIPNPATWINEGRWDDQPAARPQSTMAAFLSRGERT